jgi:Galactose oxidase, central domain
LTGTLPPGLSLAPNANGTNADLLGTPTATGTFPISVMITDAAGQTSTPQDFTILVAPHGFEFTGLMTANRLYSDAALLQDGRVLVPGGLDPNAGVLSSADLYDPAARTFSATGNMAVSRSCHTATSLNDGRVLVAGGFDGNGGELATAEIFDPAKGTFVATASMAAPRACQTATLLKDGRVLILGGLHNGPLATAELFDPANGSFSATAGPMASAHAFHTATLLADGRVLVTGGLAQQFDVSSPITSVASAELFDPATGIFSATTSDMGTARLGHTATLLSNGKVLIAGGSATVGVGPALATAEIFDPATETFANTGSMGTTRTFHTATALNDGTVLVAGGDPSDILNLGPTSSGWLPSPLASAELFDPASGLFTETGGLVNGRENHTATLLKDGTVLVIGGFWYLNEAETYQ